MNDNDIKRMEPIREIFARAILLTRKWEVLVNRTYDKDELTLKQLMVLIFVENGFDHDPTIKEVAKILVTSHQNIKALLLQLEKKGFVNLYTDPKDARVKRVKISKDRDEYWIERNKKDTEILLNLFKGISLEDLEITLKTLDTLDMTATDNFVG